MATSAFKSTTKRSSIGTPSSAGNSTSSAHRRSRSLSRFSRRVPAAEDEVFEEVPLPRGRFVNTERGSGFPEISLDDLAVDLLGSVERGRCSDLDRSVAAGSSQRRGRSVSRRGADGNGSTSGSLGAGKVVSDSISRRRRSVSVARQQISDSESQSSAVTDDEARDGCSSKNGIVKTLRTVYAQKKNEHPARNDVNGRLYEAMRKELRHAVEEIRKELEQAMENSNTSGDCQQSNNSDVAVSTVRRNYATKLEQSEKHKQDLLAEIVLQEQQRKELSKIVKELIPDSKDTAGAKKPSRARKRSNDKTRMSSRLTEEAEKYFEDFLSNVEDTDISSFDGERSDGSSTLSGIKKPREPEKHRREPENVETPVPSNSLPSEMDGLVLPWLEWETHDDISPLSCINKTKLPVTPKTLLWDSTQEGMNVQDRSNCSISSRGSWSPAIMDSPSISTTRYDLGGKYVGTGNSEGQSLKRPGFDMDEYECLKRNEDLLFERWRQQNRINSGGLLLCHCGNIFP